MLLLECGTLVDPGEAIEAFRFRKATEALLANAAAANVYIDRLAPWALRKTDPERAASVLNTACEWIALLASWMDPFLPNKAAELWSMVGAPGRPSERPWPSLPQAGHWRLGLGGNALGTIEPPFRKIEDETVAEELAALEARARS